MTHPNPVSSPSLAIVGTAETGFGRAPEAPALQAPAAISDSPRPRAKIRIASFDDYPQIVRVLERNNLRAKERREWEHLWTGNPVFQNFPDWPIGWVAENEQQQIVGYMGNIPVQYHFRGKALTAATLCSLCMDVPYRGAAGFFLRRYLTQKSLDLCLVTTANENSESWGDAGLRGSRRIPVGNWAYSSYWITNYLGFAASACKRKELPRLAGYPTSFILALQDRLADRFRPAQKKDYPITVCTAFDERFEEFWTQLRAAYPNRLLADRSRSHLKWHFRYALAQNKLWVATIQQNSRILAYAFFLRQDNPAISLRRVRLVDFQCLAGRVQLLSPLLVWALQRCRTEGIHTLECFACHPEKQAVIDSVNPRRRELPAWMSFYQPHTPEMKQALPDPAIWDPSQYDGDASL